MTARITRRRRGRRELTVKEITRTLRRLAIVQTVVALIALGGITVAIISLEIQASEVRSSRLAAGIDSCKLLRGLVSAATTHAPKDRRAAAAYIARTPLRDCRLYAAELLDGSHRQPRPRPRGARR